MVMRPLLLRVGTILFVSGFCSLVYQVVWLRLLRLVFGVSTASTAVVLAIFMGGLGLGGILLGRRAERHPRPLELYARLELGIALSAAASPLLIALARQLYIALGGVSGLGLGGATALRLLLATLILGVPTTLMGGTLPAVSQAMERAADLGRRRVAAFYGVNTLGAVVGALLTTFYLIEFAGVHQSLWLAASINLLLALAARALARQFTTAESVTPEAACVDPPPASTDPPRRLVLVAAFVVGFIFFAMELVWYRMLAPVLGGSSYTFGLILAVALVGIGLGGLLFALGPQARRPTVAALAMTCSFEALFLIVPFAAGDSLVVVAATLRSLSALGFAPLVIGWGVVTSLVILPAAVVSGYQFPLLVALLGSGVRRVGSDVGLAYGWNTFGAILGSLAAGFGLLPLLSTPGLWRLSVAVLAVLGGTLALVGAGGPRWRRGSLSVVVALLALALCPAAGPTAFWRHVPVGAGRAEARFDGPNDLRHELNATRRSLVVEADGVESSVALLRRNELGLLVNGKSDGSAISDAPTNAMSGLVGAMLHPNPRRGLVIGLGTGSTAGWMAQIPTMERLDVVELEPAVIDFAHYFEAINFGAVELPNVSLWVGDGREYVLTAEPRYDLVFSEPSNPYRAGVADLFSLDFYHGVNERLTENGILLQWLQGYEVDPTVVQIAYATLCAAFPHVETWQVSNRDLLLVASRRPILHDFDRVRARVTTEPYKSALDRVWRVEGVAGFYSGYVGGDALARALAAAEEGRVSTDDRPRIEFGFARNVGRQGLFDVVELQRLAQRLGVAEPAGVGVPPSPQLVREARLTREMADAFAELAPGAVPHDEELRRSARVAYRDGDLEQAAAAWFSQDVMPRSLYDLLLVAEALADRGHDGAEEWIAALAERAPTEAALFTARLHWRRQAAGAAVEELAGAIERLRSDPWVFRPVVHRAFQLVDEMVAADRRCGLRFLDALEEPFAVDLFEEARHVTRINLVGKVDFTRRCESVFSDLEPHVLWERGFLEARLDCYQRNSSPLASLARRELDAFIAAAPPELMVPGL